MAKLLTTKVFDAWLQEQAQNIVRYRQIEKSELLSEYTALKKIVESVDFQTKKQQLITTRYANTEEGKTMAAYRRQRKNMQVLLYRLLQKEAWKEKPEVATYLALYEQVQAPAFQQAHAFWKNNRRWLTTPEYQQEQRFISLTKHADILFYLAHTEKEIAHLESYQSVWAEEFDHVQIPQTWQTGFLYANPALKANHSHVNEMQAYTAGKNTEVSHSVMRILTRRQKIQAPAWHPTKGMIMHPFGYTSDIWHTAQAIAPARGVLQAKVHCSGKAQHILCLTEADAKQAIHILPKEHVAKEAIYTLVWDDKEVINYVNNIEVARSKNPLSGKPLHLLLRSYLTEKQKGSARMEIDWIRIYTHK